MHHDSVNIQNKSTAYDTGNLAYGIFVHVIKQDKISASKGGNYLVKLEFSELSILSYLLWLYL